MTAPSNLGYRDNPLLKRVGIPHEYTQEEIEEYIKCSKDPIHFITTYIKIVNVDEGLMSFDMWDFQKEMVTTFRDNRFVIMKMPRQVGKALDIETPILTADGFKKLKDIHVGDVIFGPDGKPTTVTFITDVMENRPCYRLTFSNGDTIIADEEHLWTVNSGNWRTGEKTLTTKELLPYLDKSNRLYINFTKSLEFDKKELEIDPYKLGIWLGDGNSSDGRITCHKDDLKFYETHFNIKSIYTDNRNANVKLVNIDGLFHSLNKLGLRNNKHIPTDYLLSSHEQRLSLLQGLMDSDGSVRKQNGGCEFYQKNEVLVDQFRYLLSSLGIKSTKLSKIVDGRIYYCVNFTTSLPAFRLPRKLNRQYCKNHPKNNRLYIESIESVDSVPVRCLQVNNQNHLFLAGNTLIPTHNTTTTVGYLLWHTIFQDQQNCAILANKGSLARDILAKYQLAYENLPTWLQQGVVTWNKGNVELENGSKLIAASTSSSAIRGGSFNLVFLDEFAFVPNNMAVEFFNSVYPVISSGKTSKIIIVSTPNGMNLFYKMWMDAVEGRSTYKALEIHWSMVPGRDEKWKEETIRNTSEDQFRQEFGTEFLGSSNTLISGHKLQMLQFSDAITKHMEMDIWEHPIKGDGEKTASEHIYVICVDVAEGRNLDYSTFTVIDVSSTPYKMVAKYRSSIISPILLPTIIYNAAKYYNDAYILIEINNNPQVAEILHSDLEYENVLKISSGNKKAQEISTGFGRGVQMGLRMSPAVKRIGCSNLKTIIETDKLLVNDFDVISELTTFVAGRSSFEAEEGANDDLVMTLVLFSWLTTQRYFKDIVAHDLRKQLQLEQFSQVDEEMLPIGELYNGMDSPFIVEDGDVWVTGTGEVYSDYFKDFN